MADLNGQILLGKYQLITRLGRGGMADVYQAHQSTLDRYVALKVLDTRLAEESDFVDRFRREAAMVARLRYPNIVQFHDLDVEGELYYMVMELVGGPTLKTELKERDDQNRPLTLAETARIFTALSSAIDYAHAWGMIYHELKPGNVMFTAEGEVVLTDFGSPLTGHIDWVTNVAFSPAGQTLASDSDDGTIILWDVGTESGHVRACRRANRNLMLEEWRQFFGEQPYRAACPDLPVP